PDVLAGAVDLGVVASPDAIAVPGAAGQAVEVQRQAPCRKRRSPAPYAAKDSRALPSPTRSRPTSDGGTVCSSTWRARPVTHSTKRCWPRRVKPRASGNRMACPRDHSWVAFIAHLLGVELSAVVT